MANIEMMSAIQPLASSPSIVANSPVNNAINSAISGGPAVKGASFEHILANIAQNVTHNIAQAEHLSLAQMSGQEVASREVVSSIMEAERSLNIAIAIRDKLVQAYLEISRMQI